MNFLPATVSDGQLAVAGHRRAAPAHLPAGDVLVGIRAEHIGIGTDGIEALVEVVEPTGAAVLLTTRVGTGAGSEVLKVSAPPTFRARVLRPFCS